MAPSALPAVSGLALIRGWPCLGLDLHWLAPGSTWLRSRKDADPVKTIPHCMPQMAWLTYRSTLSRKLQLHDVLQWLNRFLDGGASLFHWPGRGVGKPTLIAGYMTAACRIFTKMSKIHERSKRWPSETLIGGAQINCSSHSTT